MTASLAGEIDFVVLVHIAAWACGGLWVVARLYPAIVRRGKVPAFNPAQALGGLFILALSLSLWDSPGVLMTAFSLTQFAVTLAFTWIFTQRFGISACLRHLFVGVSVLALAIAAAIFLLPELVAPGLDNAGTRVTGDYIAGTGGVAVLGFVLCLSSMPRLKNPLLFWGALTLFGGLLLVSQTRTAYVALAVYLVVGFVFGKRLPVRKFIPLFAVFSLSLFFMDTLSSTTNYVVRERESVETMSDRIPLWRHLTTTVMREAPLIGLGYYAASRVVGPEYNPALGDAHSVFFEVLVGGGLLGAALYLVLCARLVWFAVRLLSMASGQPHAMAAVGLLLVTLVLGITSSQALQSGPLGFSFWSLTALLPAMISGRLGRRISEQPKFVSVDRR